MKIEPHRLRVEPPPADDPGDPALVELIRSEIERDGPMTFARFMELALYEPGLGYYATTDVRPTRTGDFLTAPELHPIFGWTVAKQIHEMWQRLGRPDQFTVREYGAGTGSLGDQLRAGLERDSSPLATLIAYEPVETAGRALAALAARGEPMTGCVIGNEFLDALPVHRVVRGQGRLRELYVDWRDGRFIESVAELSDPELVRRVRVNDLAEGQLTEVSLSIPRWLRSVAEQLTRGYVLLLDYGLDAAELRARSRATGTLRAFRGQHVSSELLNSVGHQDITAHLDLDALRGDAAAAGFEVLGTTTQARFLMGCGLEEIYAAAKEDADRDFDSALLLRSAVRRLLDPRQLGGYAVVVLGKDVPREPTLRGLAFQLR